jgi:glycerol-3-phosphate dehydrogenase
VTEAVIREAQRAQAVGGLELRPSRTGALPLHGAGAEPDLPKALRSFGSDATAVEQLAASPPEWSQPLHPNFPHATGEVVWAARHEMARPGVGP